MSYCCSMLLPEKILMLLVNCIDAKGKGFTEEYITLRY